MQNITWKSGTCRIVNVPDYRIVDFSIYFCGYIDADVIFSVTITRQTMLFEKSRAEINIFNI